MIKRIYIYICSILLFQHNVKTFLENIHILGHTIYLDKINKSHNVHLWKMKPQKKYIVIKSIYTQWIYHKFVVN